MLEQLRSRLHLRQRHRDPHLFIALGGSSYAALRVTGRPQPPKDALTGADIKNPTGKDVRNNSLTGAVESAMDRGDESRVRDVLADTGLELTFDRGIAANPLARFATVDERIEHYTTVFAR